MSCGTLTEFFILCCGFLIYTMGTVDEHYINQYSCKT
jgi:hypothetical protein